MLDRREGVEGEGVEGEVWVGQLRSPIKVSQTREAAERRWPGKGTATSRQ